MSDLSVLPAKMDDVKGYIGLLNDYYSKYSEYSTFDSAKEIKKHRWIKIFGTFLKKYCTLNHSLAVKQGEKSVGFNEYTNHKTTLLIGYLKKPNIQMDWPRGSG